MVWIVLPTIRVWRLRSWEGLRESIRPDMLEEKDMIRKLI
jgi:hypothetical protein